MNVEASCHWILTGTALQFGRVCHHPLSPNDNHHPVLVPSLLPVYRTYLGSGWSLLCISASYCVSQRHHPLVFLPRSSAHNRYIDPNRSHPALEFVPFVRSERTSRSFIQPAHENVAQDALLPPCRRLWSPLQYGATWVGRLLEGLGMERNDLGQCWLCIRRSSDQDCVPCRLRSPHYGIAEETTVEGGSILPLVKRFLLMLSQL